MVLGVGADGGRKLKANHSHPEAPEKQSAAVDLVKTPVPEATAADPTITADCPKGARVISIPEVYAALGYFDPTSWCHIPPAPPIYPPAAAAARRANHAPNPATTESCNAASGGYT